MSPPVLGPSHTHTDTHTHTHTHRSPPDPPICSEGTLSNNELALGCAYCYQETKPCPSTGGLRTMECNQPLCVRVQ